MGPESFTIGEVDKLISHSSTPTSARLEQLFVPKLVWFHRDGDRLRHRGEIMTSFVTKPQIDKDLFLSRDR